jgi:hypothetical protein
MSQTGIFSYLNDNEFGFQTQSGHKGRIRRVHHNIARICFVNGNGDAAIPNGITCQDGQAFDVPAFHNSFLITWFDRFTILEHDTPLLMIDNQKLQSIRLCGGTIKSEGFDQDNNAKLICIASDEFKSILHNLPRQTGGV